MAAVQPVLELFVTKGCANCARAERVLKECPELAALVAVEVRLIGAPGVGIPARLVGGPTVVFEGAILSLGTPDCGTLAARIGDLVGRRAAKGHHDALPQTADG